MKPARSIRLLMIAGLAAVTATACLPTHPQGAAPGTTSAHSTAAGTEQASPNGPASAAAGARPTAAITEARATAAFFLRDRAKDCVITFPFSEEQPRGRRIRTFCAAIASGRLSGTLF